MTFTLFIDESGDEGLEGLRSPSNSHGPEPLFFLGASLVRNDLFNEIEIALRKIETFIGKEIHFNKLNHEQRVFCTRSINSLPITCFGLISDKNQLGEYKSEAKKEIIFTIKICIIF